MSCIRTPEVTGTSNAWSATMSTPSLTNVWLPSPQARWVLTLRDTWWAAEPLTPWFVQAARLRTS